YMTIHSMKFYEVQKYITNVRYIFSIEPLFVSESVFQDQSPKIQQAILEAGKAATKHSATYLRESEAAIKKDLISKGMQIDDPANGEKEWIEKATQAVWPKFYESIGGKDKLNRVLRLLGRSEV
ncbi:MAG: C4-dicarboxylate ABC transporter substrate-binding protein, partial [Motiliproteus sp.]